MVAVTHPIPRNTTPAALPGRAGGGPSPFRHRPGRVPAPARRPAHEHARVGGVVCADGPARLGPRVSPVAPLQTGAVRRTRIAHRRARAVVLLSIALLVLGVVLGRLSEHSSPASVGGPVPIATTTYVVQPGDTVWSIARNAQPAGDVRPLVDRLTKQVGGGPLKVGQRLVVPATSPVGG